jgi:molecular chaperone HscB
LAAAPASHFFCAFWGFLEEQFMSTAPTSTNPPLVCWSCHERTLGTHFCASCGKLLQLPRAVDYFALFEMPRKLWIEMNGLEQKFLQLSWKLHPDNFVNATEQERELSLKHSSELNDAYRTLRDPVGRVEYLLGIEGARKEGEHKQQAPPELLEEVFELNESLDELRETKASGGDLAALKSRLESAEKSFQEKLGEVDAQLQSAARQWDAALDGDAASRKKSMAQLNELLNRRSYIRNLVTNVQKELL